MKTAAAGTALTGATVSYTVSVTNRGLVPASDVRVADSLPPELELVGCSSAAGTCSNGAGGPDVSFSALLGPGSAAATISARLRCDVADGTVIRNRAAASFALSDPSPDDNAAFADVTAVNPAPVIAGASVNPPALWPPNGKMSTVDVSYEATDSCDGTVCSLAVASNEGSAVSDWQVIDAHTVSLRAARYGAGPGRTYSLQITCEDSGGAVSKTQVQVDVPHNR